MNAVVSVMHFESQELSSPCSCAQLPKNLAAGRAVAGLIVAAKAIAISDVTDISDRGLQQGYRV